jgi:hypothetical protein
MGVHSGEGDPAPVQIDGVDMPPWNHRVSLPELLGISPVSPHRSPPRHRWVVHTGAGAEYLIQDLPLQIRACPSDLGSTMSLTVPTALNFFLSTSEPPLPARTASRRPESLLLVPAWKVWRSWGRMHEATPTEQATGHGIASRWLKLLLVNPYYVYV